MKHAFRLGAVVLLWAAAACGPKSPAPEFKLLAMDTTLVCGPVGYDVQYRFTSIANASHSPALQAIEEANIQYFFGLEDFTGTASEAIAAALEHVRRQIRDDLRSDESGPVSTDAPVREYSESSESEATVIDTLLVYTIRSSGYSGGAHGMYATMAHNYSLAGGYELTLDDLFTPAQLTVLESLIRNRLYDRCGVSSDEGLDEQGFFPEYIGPTGNFAVTENGITFYYNPYDIGCYALGDVSVDIDRDALNRLGIGR